MAQHNIRPQNVGILAMEAYFPSSFVAQTSLEEQDNCAGKYTKGLGQHRLAFVSDREDIGSVLMSALHRLLERYSIDPQTVGRLEIGTETLIDKSKSIKTSLMKFFGENKDMEGVTSTNACYGGTAALFNSIAWVQSEDWDGRYAIAIAGDIAVYEAGPARPTSGCGAVAMLIGPDAPLAMESGVRATHVVDAYDFYKPNHSEYAMVDGKLSQNVYLSCVDACYRGFRAKANKKNGEDVTVDSFGYFCFHSPYHKLVQKGFGRILFNDFLNHTNKAEFTSLQPFAQMAYEETLSSRELDTALRGVASQQFEDKVMPSSFISQNVGNCYTGAVFVNLLSLVSQVGEELVDKRVGMFSYGSGSVASLYSFIGRNSSDGKFSLKAIQDAGIFDRLATRKECTAEEFAQAMTLREEAYGKAPYQPKGLISAVPPGDYYLAEVNDRHHRTYERASN